MNYDITKTSAPKMPTLGKGTECLQILLSQASKDMHEPLVPMLFPSLGAHISGAKFQYPDLTWKEMCGLMANLVGESGCNKGQLTDLVKAICRDFPPLSRLKLEGWLHPLGAQPSEDLDSPLQAPLERTPADRLLPRQQDLHAPPSPCNCRATRRTVKKCPSIARNVHQSHDSRVLIVVPLHCV